MTSRQMMSVQGATLALCAGMSPLTLADAGAWQFAVTPYIWLPTIDGELVYAVPPEDNVGPDVPVGPTDWLELLNAAFLINASATSGRFTAFTDLVYLGMSSEKSRQRMPGPRPVDAGLKLETESELDGLEWQLALAYAVHDSPSTSMDLFAGVRYLGIDVSTDWKLFTDGAGQDGNDGLRARGSVSEDTDLWDGIVGLRGHYTFAPQWSLPYYLDVGTGSSDLTWQVMLGVSYTFSWGDLMLTYRHLEYDQDSGELLQNFSFSGPALAARFHL
jgi:hypothetical protein